MMRIDFLPFLLIGLLSAGCGEEIGAGSELPAEQGGIMFVHAAPAAPSLDMFVDGRKVIADRQEGIVQSDYLAVDAGEHLFQMRPNGENRTLADRPMTLTKGGRYTLFGVNDTLGSFDLLLYRDNLTPPPAGKANVRIANLVPDAPAIRLAFSGSGLGPIFNNVRFLDNMESFTAVNARNVTLRIIDAAYANGGSGGGNGTGGGTGGGGKNKHALVSDLPATLKNGGIYTVALVGRLADSSARIVMIEHPPQRPLYPHIGG